MIIALILIELRDLCHFFLCQRKVQDIQVVFDVVNILAAGDHDESHLGVPTEDDLGRALAILLSKLREDRLLDQGFISMSERIPGHELDAVLVQRLSEFLLGEVRMCLHLDELRNNFPFCLQIFDVLAFKVGDADRLCLAFFIGFFQLSVTGEPVACRLVDIKQIHIIHAKALQGLIYCIRVFILARPEFCGKEDFFALQTTVLDAASAGAFIHVCICGVYKGVTHLQGFPDAVFCFCRGEHKGSDPDYRALNIVVQYCVFHG